MNNVILLGNLIKDPFNSSNDTLSICKFTLAVGFKTKDHEGVDFISCVAFNKTAELILKHCTKGSKVLIEGRIKTSNYETTDGQKVYRTDVVCSTVQFLNWKKQDESTLF